MIKLLSNVTDGVTGHSLPKGTIVDLGAERNEKAVNNKFAVWVDDQQKDEPTEKKEGTPRKTTSSVKGKKIETK